MAVSNTSDFTDNAMLELFRSEVDSHVQTLTEGLLALEKDAGRPELIEPLMRAAHSIKGAARIVGVEAGVRIAHVTEDCLVAAQNGQLQLGSEAIDVLLRGVDALNRSGGTAPPDAAEVEKLVHQISTIRLGKPAVVKKPEPAVTVRTDGATRIVAPPGNLDAAGAEQLRRELVEQLDAGSQSICLDLTAVHEVDATGLALLALFAEGAEPRSLAMDHVAPELIELFQAVGLAGSYRLAGS